jgi:hypothetical protein
MKRTILSVSYLQNRKSIEKILFLSKIQEKEKLLTVYNLTEFLKDYKYEDPSVLKLVHLIGYRVKLNKTDS